MKTLFCIIGALSAMAAAVYGAKAYRQRGSGFGVKALICLAMLIAAVLALPWAYSDDAAAQASEVHITRAPVTSGAEGDLTPPAAAVTSTPAPSAQSADTAEGEYVASCNSDKFHRAGCTSAGKILEENRVWFSSAEEALSAGYTPCGRCKP